MIFNFTSAYAVEDFEFNWQKHILKFYIKTHKHIFFFSAEKQFYYKYLTQTDYDLGDN